VENKAHPSFDDRLRKERLSGATIFGKVNAEQYSLGITQIDSDSRMSSSQEKQEGKPASNQKLLCNMIRYMR
jgi:hypothetical protein